MNYLQKKCLDDIDRGFYLNKEVVNQSLVPDEMYLDIKKKYGNHSSVYNIITGQ